MTPLRLLNRTVRAVIRREYLQRITNKWFVITTFLVPIVMAGIVVFPGWLLSQGGGGGEPLRVGVVDRTGAGLAAPVARELVRGRRTGEGTPGTGADERPGGRDASDPGPAGEGAPPFRAAPARDVPPGAGPEQLAELLRVSEFDAYLVLGPDLLSGEDAELLSLRNIGVIHRPRIRRAVRNAAMAARMRRAGLPPSQTEGLLRVAAAGLSTIRVAEGGLQSQVTVERLGVGMGAVLYMMLLVYGQTIAKGVVEEKSSDIVEVLLSSLRPWELMLGKILGVAAVSLTQVAVWAAVLGAVVTYGLAAAAPALSRIGFDPTSLLALPLVEILAGFVVFFLLGYLLYASLFAAAGATVGSEQDAQQVSLPISLLIVVAVMFLLPMVETPDATWAVVISQVPLFSPVLVPARIAVGAASAWEILLAAALLVAGVLGAVWLAGRIYRVGILMSGKRPSLPELARWIRYG